MYTYTIYLCMFVGCWVSLRRLIQSNSITSIIFNRKRLFHTHDNYLKKETQFSLREN